MLEDLEYVLTEGPWVIANQYLVVQKWRPNFVPGEDKIQKIPVWVRLSKLPMEWIDVDLLRSIGGMLGTTFKVDPITESQARGRFTRICVEIDITKPLKSILIVEDRVIKVEYESLGVICFKCGRVGHTKDLCREEVVEQDEVEKNTECENKSGSGVSDPYGPWMQVTYGRNGRNMGAGFAGKRGNIRSNVGDAGSGVKYGNGLGQRSGRNEGNGKTVAEVETTGTSEGIGKDVTKVVVGNSKIAVDKLESRKTITKLVENLKITSKLVKDLDLQY
ncbi:hypothetical protein Ddye_020406 [Dipteronia dyeriana]|uniref:CCHC-type domain-containing protein n=1 Tax=Dipteronia dyeriana TaxID=168575 RepID=A0AAD9WVZ0_9ROSI|nr:hypothetical protein Ddye_020406 [Dipteronia dyeriana]